jgi:hypothetical protein
MSKQTNEHAPTPRNLPWQFSTAARNRYRPAVTRRNKLPSCWVRITACAPIDVSRNAVVFAAWISRGHQVSQMQLNFVKQKLANNIFSYNTSGLSLLKARSHRGRHIYEPILCDVLCRTSQSIDAPRGEVRWRMRWERPFSHNNRPSGKYHCVTDTITPPIVFGCYTQLKDEWWTCPQPP